MDEKISLESISRYSDAYTEKMLADIFSSKDKITGPEILALSSVQQVNLFVVKSLFTAWKDDTKKIKSPYFNYESEEVKAALKDLMDTLSNNIAVDKLHFTPLFKKAVSQTLLAVFDPYDFFSMIIAGENNRLEVGRFREEIKYLKINKAPLERLLQKLEQSGVAEISGNEAFAILDQILEEVNFTPEDVDIYLAQFSEVVPLDADKFYVKEIRVEETIAAIPQNTNGPDKAANLPNAEKVKTPSINDALNKSSKSLADNFQKITKIKDSLTINQKFMFTKVLFHGDFELFSKAIDQLDRQDSMKGALRYLEQEHASTWDKDSEEFHEFMELVEKRFAS